MRIDCPFCGERDQREFHYGGDASVERPAEDAPLDAWYRYVYVRDNPKGEHREYWHHTGGCRAWLRVTRNTATHEVLAVAYARATSDTQQGS